ncbi:hypothetical protein [uncultured Tenacibaculum sp.]|uniref:hypothetical protein n=1 Tax=uncultured Tenacibaculum sp. TaxID=174713 RepID=UPI002623DD6B|nr:hypothetical protein [uncultured Tenacibaculum sp.]
MEVVELLIDGWDVGTLLDCVCVGGTSGGSSSDTYEDWSTPSNNIKNPIDWSLGHNNNLGSGAGSNSNGNSGSNGDNTNELNTEDIKPWWAEDGIIDNTNNPCVSEIINTLKQKDLNGTLIPNLGGKTHLSQMILELFNSSREYNLKFSIVQLDDIGEGVNGNTNGFHVTLDTDMIDEATRLFIAKTIIHESLHAYLHYITRSKQNSTITSVLKMYHKLNNYKSNLTEHQFMGEYVEALAYSLSAYDNHRQNIDYYKALSWAGLESSSSYKSLTNKTEIQRIIKNERDSRRSAKSAPCDS